MKLMDCNYVSFILRLPISILQTTGKTFKRKKYISNSNIIDAKDMTDNCFTDMY